LTKIIVVGAGIAGLTAAYHLNKAGNDVTVLEAEDHVGGRMYTIEWEGFQINPGAQFFTGADKYLLEMTEQLGLSDQLKIRFDDGLYFAIYRNEHIYPVNFLSIGSYLSWKGVSLKARLAMVKLMPYLMRYMGQDVYHMERAPGDDIQSFEEFFRQHISSEMFDYWAYPTFQTNCSYDGKDFSRKAFLTIMMGYMNSKTYQLDGGIGALPEAIAKQMDVILGARVTQIGWGDDGVSVRFQRSGEAQNLTAERLVVAVPGFKVLDFIPEPQPAWQAFFPQVAYAPVATQFHIFEKSDFDHGAQPADGIMLPNNTPDYSIAFAYFQQHQGDRWLMLTEPKAYGYDTRESDQVALDRSWNDVVRIYPELDGTHVTSRQFYWPGKVPAFRAGYLDAVAAFWNDPQENPVFFCGDYFAGPGTGAALYTGWECANRVQASLS